MLQMGSACAAENVTYYVDPAGNDNNPGTLSQPFKTIKKAVATLGTSIGTVYLRGGFYPPETSIVRLTLDKSGVPGNWIKIWAYNDERPIIDFTGGTSVWPNGTEGFRVLGSYYHLKGLTIQNATGWGIVLHGSNNIVENCVSRNNHGTGIKIINTTADMGGGVIQSFVPANNLIVNSDAIGNHSVGDGGNNADGISVAYTIGPGNILRGNRAWNNGDDGFDLWMASAPVLIENNYAFGNGVNRWAEPGLWRGNGDGFKLGGGGVNTAHIVRNNLAFDNGTPGATAGNGFDQNSNHGGIQLYNNLAVRNTGMGFHFTSGATAHVIKNNAAFGNSNALNQSEGVASNNSWQLGAGRGADSSDFVKSAPSDAGTFTQDPATGIMTGITGMYAPRNNAGQFAYPTGFLQLASGSDLIDAGTPITAISFQDTALVFPFSGAAPDLGAFEFSAVDPTATIPPLHVVVASATVPSTIADMRGGVGPSFMADLVRILSSAVGQNLRYVSQNALGTVVLQGYNNGNLAFIPLTFQTGDARSDGVYSMGNGQYQVVRGGQSLVIAPALVQLDQLLAQFPGVSAIQTETGILVYTFDGVTRAVQPGVSVQTHAPGGSARMITGSDGYTHFIDTNGNEQVLYPAFVEPDTVRKILLTLDATATLNIELDGSARIWLYGLHYTLVPDMVLGSIPATRSNQPWWQEDASRYRYATVQTQPAPGTMQALTVR